MPASIRIASASSADPGESLQMRRFARSFTARIHNVWVSMLIQIKILYIRKFSRGFYFRETSHMRSFVKIESSPNGEITLSITDLGKSSTSREFLAPQNCLLTLFAKMKILAKIFGFTV